MVLEQDKGLYIDFGETGRSAIHLAAMLSDLDMCKWLLSKGVDVRCLTKNAFEDSVLHCAAMNKSHGKELVRYFVFVHNFDVNTKYKLGFTPLHCALYKENIETAEVLLTLGADLAVKRITKDSNNLENLLHCCLSISCKLGNVQLAGGRMWR
ncbi:putative ankyrin repeat protein RF_0381 [Cloeon dipterum]|uniref:putative ankyrin repeat protein RF_0381 n=1 Tax=Cloeon dipterum TaxID=197152 RepID=UPI00321FEEC8